MADYYLETAESVTNGHPDKICDQISDAILDAYLELDPNARVAVETLVTGNTVMIAGEVTAKAGIDITAVARRVITDIGYTQPELGFCADTVLILTHLSEQSLDIARGVDSSEEVGGGDQGIMYGYACDETDTYMPLSIFLAHKLVRRLQEVREEGIIPWLKPDGKAQVTIKYDLKGTPLGITSIVLSAQHEDINMDYLRSEISHYVIDEVIPAKLMLPETKLAINPTGRFVIGGPVGDTGLTGRKIMVDSYGGVARHGGGAFSGKDGTKVDRTGAYMARYVAKNVVAAGLASRCEIAVAYAIGKATPEAVNINTFGTETLPKPIILAAVKELFSFRVGDMIRSLNLRKAQFQKTAVYGHFGRNQGFAWEEVDKKDCLKELCLKSLSELLKK